MTTPLNKAIDCCDSEVDGEIAGLDCYVCYAHNKFGCFIWES